MSRRTMRSRVCMGTKSFSITDCHSQPLEWGDLNGKRLYLYLTINTYFIRDNDTVIENVPNNATYQIAYGLRVPFESVYTSTQMPFFSSGVVQISYIWSLWHVCMCVSIYLSSVNFMCNLFAVLMHCLL